MSKEQNSETVSLSNALVNELVNYLGRRPYVEAAPLLSRIAFEAKAQSEKQPEPPLE